MHVRSSFGFCFALTLMASCGQVDDTSDWIVLEGMVEKGPFVLGSTVTAAPLNHAGNSTGDIFGTSTINDRGEFWVEVPKAGPVALEGSGYYYNEVSGELSTGWITLRAIYMASKNESNPISVNPITHLSYERVRALREQGQSFANAITIAEQELRAALGIGPAELVIAEPGTALSILGGDTLPNAYLFAVSSVLAQAGVNLAGGLDGPIDAHLQELMNSIALDLADDGQIAPDRRATLDAAQLALDVPAVEAALAARLAAIGSNAAVPDLDAVLDQDGDLLLNIDDNCDRISNADQADLDMDGVGDVCDNCIDIANADQSDIDHDGFGDVCDLECGDGELDPDEQCDDGNLIDGDGCNNDCVISGQLLWEREIGPYPDAYPLAQRLAVDPDGNVIVAGGWVEVATPWMQTGFVQRYDADGELLLHSMQPYIILSLLPEAAGNTLLASAGLTRIDDQGQTLWSYEQPLGYAIGRTSDGLIISTTQSGGVAAIDISGEATMLWSDSSPSGLSYAYMAVAPDDTIHAIGYTVEQPFMSYLDSWDADGNLLSTASPVDSPVAGLDVLPSGELVLGWYEWGETVTAHISLLSPDASTMLWTVTHDQPSSTFLYGLDVDALGRIAYTWAHQAPGETPREHVTKLDSNGLELWTADLDHGDWEQPYGVAFGPDGSVHTLTAWSGRAWLHKFAP